MRYWLILLLGAAGLAPSSLLAAELLVIRSDVAELKAGAVIQSTNAVKLPAGSRVMLVAADGRTIRLAGPFAGPPEPGAESAPSSDRRLLESLRKLFAPADDERMAIGASRGPASDVWRIEVLHEGIYCVPENQAPVLSRATAADDALVEVEQPNGGPRTSVRFPPGQRIVPWPQELPVVDQARYRLRSARDSESSAIVLRLVPAALASDVHRAAWMADNGCTEQARRLMERMQ
jgi:hypothetical protein